MVTWFHEKQYTSKDILAFINVGLSGSFTVCMLPSLGKSSSQTLVVRLALDY
jgi:hypothetical protein